MDVKDFEKKVAHLDQPMILAIAVSVINKILISKGIATKVEMEEAFLEYMHQAEKKEAEKE